MDAADNALIENELEPKIDDDDDEARLNCFKVEYLDEHGRNWQACYLAEWRHCTPQTFILRSFQML
jgi:hypothetical protein